MAGPAMAKELLAYAAHGVLLSLASRLSLQSAEDGASRRGSRSVFLLHGYMARGTVLLPMKRWLDRRIEGQVVIFDYGGPPDLPALSGRFARFVEEQAPDGRVDLIGHSLGGLIARFWMQELGGAPRVDHCISMGTPHAGTESARLWPFGAAREFLPGAPLLARLEASHPVRTAGVKHTCIVAEDDLMVRPASNAILEGSSVHLLHELGHNGLLFSPRVFRIVADALAR
ncbi:MAG: alpha/beta fold hydrolase [Deltaproteobacteria bacterium]|nr:alpha/beta fold hydrolase [Deltaproteobacteria bacterium]